MLIEKAYEGRPDAPRYDGADHFMGYRDTDAGVYVDPAAVKFQAQKMKSETDALREVRLKKEEEKPGPGGKANGKP